MDLMTCAKLMIDHNISSLIISTNENSNRILRGILTKSDLLDAFVKSYSQNVTLSEYMTKKVLTVKRDNPLHIALLIMADSNVSRMIVVEDDSKPVGIITSHDLLPASSILLAYKIISSTEYWSKGKHIADERAGNTVYKSNLPYGMKRIL
jgi:predicted transcriptional regulator